MAFVGAALRQNLRFQDVVGVPVKHDGAHQAALAERCKGGGAPELATEEGRENATGR